MDARLCREGREGAVENHGGGVVVCGLGGHRDDRDSCTRVRGGGHGCSAEPMSPGRNVWGGVRLAIREGPNTLPAA